jgi:hypothetical protein
MQLHLLLPGLALLLLTGSAQAQLGQGLSAAAGAAQGQLDGRVQTFLGSLQGQLHDVVAALAKSGQLPVAAQTIAGFVSHTICEGAACPCFLLHAEPSPCALQLFLCVRGMAGLACKVIASKQSSWTAI